VATISDQDPLDVDPATIDRSIPPTSARRYVDLDPSISDASPELLRAAMTVRLVTDQVIHTDAVRDAFATVPRSRTCR
jgi:hypothetical protein